MLLQNLIFAVIKEEKKMAFCRFYKKIPIIN